MRNLFRFLSVTILFSLVLSACASATPTAQPEASGTIVIRAGTGDGGTGLTPHQQIIQNFEDGNPDVIVQLEPVSGRDYYARLLTQLSAKAAPDIMQVGDDAVPSFVSKNAFVALTPTLEDSNFDTSIYLPGLLDPGKVDGKQYLVPWDWGYESILVRSDKGEHPAGRMGRPVGPALGRPHPDAGRTAGGVGRGAALEGAEPQHARPGVAARRAATADRTEAAGEGVASQTMPAPAP